MMVFTQWDKLVSLLTGIARNAVNERTQYGFNRIDVSTERASLVDRSMNQLTLSGGVVTLVMPEPEVGRAHDLLVRAVCEADTELAFEGAEFEGEDGEALAAPSAGETVIYLFTETAPGVFLASRKAVEKIGTEG